MCFNIIHLVFQFFILFKLFILIIEIIIFIIINNDLILNHFNYKYVSNYYECYVFDVIVS